MDAHVDAQALLWCFCPTEYNFCHKTPGCVGVHACFLYAHGFMLSFINSEVPYFPFTYRQSCSDLGVVNFQELLIPNEPWLLFVAM